VVVIYQFTSEVTLIIPALAIAAIVAYFERRRRDGEAIWAPFGVIYLILPCIAMIALRGSGFGIHDRGFKLLAFIILIVIAADVGAYFGGRYFQGPKLAPKLSPKKTWSGLFSGLLAGVLMGFAYGYFLKMGSVIGAMIAIPIVLLSVAGDFMESGIKRRMNVKDAGDILPGHGGLLDRLDSLILVVIVTMIMVHTPLLRGLI